MPSKFRFFGWGTLFVAIIVVGVGLMVYSSRQPSSGGQAVDLQLGENERALGRPDAPAVLVEYSDFQCPACAEYFRFIEQLAVDFPNDLRIIYRHFPLTMIHQNAMSSARAAEAAARQGKFFEMEKTLFEHQNDWANSAAAADIFKGYAAALGLDAQRFAADLADPSLDDKIKSDADSAAKLKLNGTPTFFLNGKQLANPRTYDGFKILVQQAIDNAAKK